MGQPTPSNSNDPLFLMFNQRNTRQQHRLSRREMREQQITSLQNYIKGTLIAIQRLLKRERVYPIFRFNDLNTEAKRKFTYHFRVASYHATIYHMKLTKLMNILETANPILWQSWAETGLYGIQTRYEINRISSWIYNYTTHPEMITPLEGEPTSSTALRNSYGIEIDRRVNKTRYQADCPEFTEPHKKQIQLWLDTGEEVSINSLNNETISVTNTHDGSIAF